ncbi:MAG: crossover junction endodeoxyribonuclease RuvC [Phycisphaerales bacterium]|nr:crossover junction endodeoxyribonuclease RuvC [Phycisphaerales bacterium]
MRVLGIDPGLQRTGYGCIEATPGGDVLIEAGVLSIPSKAPMPQRLAALDGPLRTLIADLRPELVIVESVFAHRIRGHTAMLMGHARGVILLAIANAGCKMIELAPAEVKKAVTGSGRADKTQVQQAVAAQLELASPPEPSDAADALALALCGLRRLNDEVAEPR